MSSSAANVDIALVLDTSSSMRPCFDQLRSHLHELIKPMQGYAARMRFGLVGLSVTKVNKVPMGYRIDTLAGSDFSENQSAIYGQGIQTRLFAENADQIIAALGRLKARGDEDNLAAIDFALDFPFGNLATTKRIVALFSDEPLERGATKTDTLAYIPAIVQKLNQRHVKLFCAMPYSDGAQMLGEANGAEIEAVDGRAGLATVDFRQLLQQMGKSISVSSLQAPEVEVEAYKRALFGQDRWQARDGLGYPTGDVPEPDRISRQ